MTDNTIDQQLKRFSSAVAHASPDPLPISEPSGKQQFKKPVLALVSAFVGVMLTLGLGAFAVSWMRSSENDQRPVASADGADTDIEAYWEWLTADAVPLEPGVIGVTQTGPVPTFDPSNLGEFQRLLSYAESPQELNTRHNEPPALPPVAHLGTIEGTATHVALYRTPDATNGETLLCLEDGVSTRGSTACYSNADLTSELFMWMASIDTGTPGSTGRIAVAMLPEGTSVVVVEPSDGRAFVQRPIGGAAAFEVVRFGDSSSVLVQALDENGDVLISDTVRIDSTS